MFEQLEWIEGSLIDDEYLWKFCQHHILRTLYPLTFLPSQNLTDHLTDCLTDHLIDHLIDLPD